MPKLLQNLIISRCPHCSVANPNLFKQHSFQTNNHANDFPRMWYVYTCGRCGGVVTAWGVDNGASIAEYFPSATVVNEDIPDRPRSYLQQAIESIHAPAGAVMLAASSVDSMLKIKGYKEGTLYARIENAVKDNIITVDMGQWAHDVRLDANDQRHADDDANLPTPEDAQRVIDFTIALAEILFVLPSKVQRGMNSA